ncbi:eCIS core domain-containing protein [Cellulomonas sp. NPDC055163]
MRSAGRRHSVPSAAPTGPAEQARPAAGTPLSAPQRASFEHWFGTDLSAVRIDTGSGSRQAAARMSARAFAIGSHISFAGSPPGSSRKADGGGLLAHELAHVIQNRNGPPTSGRPISNPADAAEREAEAAAHAWVSGAPSPPLRARAGARISRQPDDPDRAADAVPGSQLGEVDLQPLDDWVLEIDSSDPAVLGTPPGTAREQIAQRLYGNPTHFGGFDPVDARRVRLRNLRGVRPDTANRVRAAFDRRLPRDVDAVVAILVQRRIDGDEEMVLLNTTEWWATRGDFTNGAGASYFDAYVDLLDTHHLTEWGLFSDTIRPASEWLIIEADEKKWAIHALIGRRSSRRNTQPSVPSGETPGYTPATGPITAAPRPWNEARQAIGGFRYAIGEDRFLRTSEHRNLGTIQAGELLVDERSASAAEIRLRNVAPQRGRVMIPGRDGHFYGYTISYPEFWNADYVQPTDPDKMRLERFWWDYPGTVFMPGGAFQPDFAVGGEAERTQRAEILQRALTAGLAALRGLDFDVLSIMTFEQRITVLDLAAGSNELAELSLISRILYTTPVGEFPALEHRISTNGTMARLLNTPSSGALAMVGRIFTMKALEAGQVPGESLENLPEFTVGFDSDGFYRYAYPRTSTQGSQLLAANQVPTGGGVGIGRERAGEREAAGPIQRTVAMLQPAIFRQGGTGAVGFAKDLVRGIGRTMVDDVGPAMGPYLPTQLVRVTTLGPNPQSRVVSVLEAVGLLAFPEPAMLSRMVSAAVSGGQVLLAVSGLARAFGPAFVEGMAARTGARGVAAGLAEAAAGEAGRAALVNAALVGSMELIEHNRAALAESPGGRAFLQLYEVTMVIWVSRDLGRLIASGLVPRLAAAAERLIALPGRLRQAVMPLNAELQAFTRALARYPSQAEALAAATNEGLTVAGGQGAPRPGFMAMLRITRGEVAAERLLGQIAGTPAGPAARRVLDRLGSLITRGEAEAAQAAGRTAEAVEARTAATARTRSAAEARFAISQRAAQLRPDAREAFLRSVEAVVNARPNSLSSLTDLLTAAAESRTPAVFLTEVQTLVSRRGVSDEALGVLGRKARNGRQTLDLVWLNRTSITDDALDFLGRDKRTNWDLYRRAAQTPNAGNVMRDFRTSARGAGAEMVGAEEAGRLAGTVRRQVTMGGSEIDFEIIVAGRRHGFEIKGWTAETWEEALDAAIKRLNRRGLTDAEQQAVRKIDHMIGQLSDAQAATRRRPYLGITDALDDRLRDRLRRVLRVNGLGSTELVPLPEARIKQKAAITIGEALGVARP